MPTYEYACPRCLNIHDVIKLMAELDRVEECPNCPGQLMERQVTAARINTSNCQFQAHFNHGLGKVVNNQREVKEELRRIKGNTGREIVEIGNDTLKSVKKIRTPYTVDYRD